MQILLADDERFVRLGLQSMLEELFPGEHTFLHARNGNEVVDLLKEHSPDIAFLDVKMPLMDGLSALKACRSSSPSTVWIILSGYADFEYARQSLSLSAFDYILKPIDLSTLRNLFERISVSREHNRRQNNTVFSHDIIRSFNMADQFSLEEVEFLPSAASDYILYQFYIDIFDHETQSRIKQKLCGSLGSYCEQNAIIVNHCLFFNTDGNLCLVCDTADASRLTHFISLQGETLPPNAFSVFWGNRKTVREIYEVGMRIAKTADIRMVKDCSHPVYIRNVEALSSLSALLSFSREISSVLNLYIGGHQGAFRGKLLEMRGSQEMRQTFELADLSVLQNYLSGFFRQEAVFQSYDGMLLCMEQCAAKHNDADFAAANTDIAAIKAFVYKNYADDVSMSRMSEQFSLSPTYLSRLFHEKTGLKYIDFVTQVRMEAAKQLLLENAAASVKRTAEDVGYSSVRHFSKTFQKYTGVIPSEYHLSQNR